MEGVAITDNGTGTDGAPPRTHPTSRGHSGDATRCHFVGGIVVAANGDDGTAAVVVVAVADDDTAVDAEEDAEVEEEDFDEDAGLKTGSMWQVAYFVPGWRLYAC